MDQSKWALPRLRHGVQTKALQKLERPRIKLQGTWAHGVCLCLHVVEVRQGSDATMVLEAICRSLEHVHQRLQDRISRIYFSLKLHGHCS